MGNPCREMAAIRFTLPLCESQAALEACDSLRPYMLNGRPVRIMRVRVHFGINGKVWCWGDELEPAAAPCPSPLDRAKQNSIAEQ
jgi:hypothetical protein